MEPKISEPRFALLPLTPRGVAAYARAGFGRLFAVQLLVATFSGLAVLWFCEEAWFPSLRQAIAALPDEGEIRGGTLRWQGSSPVMLAGGDFLSFAVDLEHTATLGQAAQVRVEFGVHDVRFCSLLGCLVTPYPRGSEIAFNRVDLEPWWGARQPFIRLGVVVATATALMLTWFVLSLLYVLPVWIIGVLSNRELGLLAAWRVAGAALIPGAFAGVLAIVLYGLGVLDVVRFVLALALHFLVVWGYLATCPFFLPRAAGVTGPRGNPFGGGDDSPPSPGSNPFRPPDGG